MAEKNIYRQHFEITREDREARLGQKSCLIWFTGLSGSGKSTLANALDSALLQKGHTTYLLDGDNVRHGLNKDLGFSLDDRSENIRRIAEAAKLFVDAGIVVIASFISPLEVDRERVRKTLGDERYVEVYVNTPIEVCEKRDVKGLYKKARSGEIPEFTGISSPYEIPLNPDLRIDTGETPLEEALKSVLDLVLEKIKR